MSDGTRYMAGLIQGFNSSQDRYLKLQADRDTQSQNRERLDIQKKELDLRTRKFNAEGKMSPAMKAIIDVEHAKIKAQNELIDGGTKQTTQDINSTQQQMQGYKTEAQKFMDVIRSGNVDYSVGPSGVTLKSKKKGEAKLESKRTRAQKASDMIDAGGFVDDGDLREIPKEDMERRITAEYGSDWKDDPKTVKKFNKKYGYFVGQKENIPGKGKVRYIGNGQWEEIE